MFEALYLRDNANDYRMTALRRVQDAGGSVKGKVIVVTGATGALGKVLASAFLQGGATVVMTGRSMSKGEQVKEEILQTAPEGATLVPMVLDLADLESVQTFAKDLKAKFPKGIFALVNNAGMLATSYKETKQGMETSFQANFVSQVLLTELLIPQLTNVDSLPARIVNLSSLGHADAPNPIQWDKIPCKDETSFVGGYNKEYFEAKWLMTAYTANLARRFNLDEPSTIVAVSADPGMSPDSAMWDQVLLPARILARYVFKPLLKTSPQAAACAAHLAVASSLHSGGYYQSGVLLEKPMRPDCASVEEWKKAVDLLKKVVPQEFASILDKIDA